MSSSTPPPFLDVPAETARQIAQADWAAVGMPSPADWPAGLKSLVGTMLRSPVAMVLLWGEQGVMIYNDVYGELTKGDNKIAMPVVAAWPEIAEWNLDMLRKVRAGETATFRNMEMTLHRGGREDTIFFDLAYSPALDDSGAIGGMLVVVNETTQEVLSEQIRAREEDRQRRMLDQMPGFAAVLVGPDHVFQYVNDAYRRIGGHRDYIGRPVREVFPELAEQGFYELLDRVYATGERFVAGGLPIRLSQNTEESYVELLYEPIRDDAGAPVGIFVGGYDATDIHKMAAELAEREAFMSGVLRSSTDCIKVLDLDGRLTFMSEGGQKVMEVDDFQTIANCPWPTFWEGEGNQAARAAVAAAVEGRPTNFVGPAQTAKGTPKWWDVSVSPIMGPDGKPARILSVSRDSTSAVLAQERQKLLNAELGHRLKNVLTMTQAIATQTFRRADSIAEALDSFSARLAAFGKATDVLTATAWDRAALRDIVASGLYAAQDVAERIDVDGDDVEFSGQAGLALTLALHELTTNARKYGALSNADGQVRIRWRKTSPGDGEPTVRFEWTETGGPPVQTPRRRGFGSRMIEQLLTSYLDGEALLRFEPTGVTFSIDVPVVAPIA